MENISKQRVVHLTAKDFVIETFKASGKGGQHRNKTESAVRIKHPPSGAVGECSEERSQYQNKKIAFERLVKSERFQNWIKLEHNRIIGLLPTEKEIEEEVDRIIERDLNNGNIKIEYFEPRE